MKSFNELELELQQAERALSKIDSDRLTEEERVRLQFCLTVISSMKEEGDLWSKHCLFNIHYIGNRFGTHLINTKDNPVGNLEVLFISCTRFLFELDLALTRDGFELSRGGDLYDRFKDLKQKIYWLSERIEDHQLLFAMYEMPIHIMNFYMGKEGLHTFIEYDKKREEVQKALDKLQIVLSEKLEEAERLKQCLDSYQTAFNFVGLSKGFENLLDKKRSAKKWTLSFLSALGIIVIAPLIFELWYFIQGNDVTWQKMLPVITLELILIYFFRVILNNYQSLQAQIIQIELRQALCQFIQSYAEYAKKIKKDDTGSLEKFESLIFSSILAHSDKIPGTFDGLESLTSLIKEWKSK